MDRTHDLEQEGVRAAIRRHRRLLLLEPEHPGYRAELARLYEADGTPDLATGEWIALGRDRLRRDDTPGAVEATREALRLDPTSLEARGLLASAHAATPGAGRVARALIPAPSLQPAVTTGGSSPPSADDPIDAEDLIKVVEPEDIGAELASMSIAEFTPFDSVSFGPDSDLSASLSSAPSVVLEPRPAPSTPELPLLTRLPRPVALELLEKAERRAYGAGSLIVGEGAAADALGLVISGGVRLTMLAQDGVTPVELGTCGVGGHFGEVELLSGQPWALAARATEMTVVLVLDRETVTRLCGTYPDFSAAVHTAAERAVRQRHLARSALFAALPGMARAAVATLFRPLTLNADDILYASGSRPPGVYLVSRGHLELRQGSLLVGLAFPGAFLGGAAHFEARPTKNAARAAHPAEVLRISLNDLDRVLEKFPAGATALQALTRRYALRD